MGFGREGNGKRWYKIIGFQLKILIFIKEIEGDSKDKELGLKLALRMKAKGADKIIEGVKNSEAFDKK